MLVRKALERGITAVSGLYMLVAQAVYASSIFTDSTYDKKIIDDIYKQIYNSKRNIVLIGMPTCGKTTISKVLADKLNKEVVDTDTLVEQEMGTTIKEYLKTHDETSFRDIETKVINNVSKLNNLIISTGGGVIKRKNNMEYLKANGIIVFIDRPLELLQVSDTRPLSSNQSDLEKLYHERYDLYCNYSDIIVKNDQDLELVINEIINEVK
jgi:shikimate dehydrogenase